MSSFETASSVTFAVAFAAAACTSAPAPGELPVLEIATDATFAPFHYVDGEGRATGFEIELARLAAERAGLQPIVEVKRYQELLRGLPDGRHDVVAATTGVTAEREAKYLFTEPHFETCQAVLVRSGDDEPASLDGLVGWRVGASGSGTAARAMRSIDGAEHVALDVEGVAPLVDGHVDAIVVDEWDAVEMARESSGRLGVLPAPVAREHYAFVLARGRDDLRDELNRALTELERDGDIARLMKRFGVVRDDDWPVQWGTSER